MLDPTLHVTDLPAGTALEPGAVELLGGDRLSCTMRLPDKSSGSASPLFSRQRRIKAASSLPMIIRASEPPMKERRNLVGLCPHI